MALLDFPNGIGPKGSNYDCERSYSVGIVTLEIIHPAYHRRFFDNGSTVVLSSVTTVSGAFVT